MKTNSFRKISLIIPLFFALLSTTFVGKGQNLVPNGDFEDTLICPPNHSHLEGYVSDWLNPTSNTPDYFNSCNTLVVGVPDNIFGFQYAHSGVAYAGIHLWEYFAFNWREYIEIPLTSNLAAGNCYQFEMYVNNPNKCRYVTDDVGIYFSGSLITAAIYTMLPYVPQISNTSGLISDTLNWTLISGNYTATGGENHLIIGNFNHDTNTTHVLNNINTTRYIAYIYIDDVSLTPCTAIEEQNQQGEIKIYPNPVKDYLTVQIKEKAEIIITDILGKEIYRHQLQTSNFKLQTSNFRDGIYFIEINNGKNIFRKKFLKE